MAKPNYTFEKRQKELAKIKKREEKRLKKLNQGAKETHSEQPPSAGDEEKPIESGI